MNLAMNTAATTRSFPWWRCYLLEVRYELLRQVRAPAFVLPTLLFPTAFYLLFGVMLSRSAANAEYMLAGYGVFGIMGAALFGFGAGIAHDRERGLLPFEAMTDKGPAHPIFGTQLFDPAKPFRLLHR